jgi:hypothetical protein
MSVTPRLSREFVERMGEPAADELLEVLTHMHGVNRTELQQLNEVNFVRFDARLEQRVGELRAYMDGRFASLEAKLEQRIGELRAYVDGRFASLEAKLDQRTAELGEKVERGLKEQTRWMFVAWASLLIPIIGLWMRG